MTVPFDLDASVRFFLALVLVLGLVVLTGWVVRKAGGGALMTRTAGRRRLHLIESLPLDARHRLVLIRRDGTDHLLILSTGTPVVVETGIPLPPGQPDPQAAAPPEKPR